jgi:type IV secretion system protein VirB3
VAGALAEPVMLAGMPREYAILVGTVAVVIGLALRPLVARPALVGGDRRARPLRRPHDKRFFDVLRATSPGPATWTGERSMRFLDEHRRRPALLRTTCPGPRWSRRAWSSTRTALSPRR